MKFTEQGPKVISVSIPVPGVELIVSHQEEDKVIYALFNMETGAIGEIAPEAAEILGYVGDEDPNVNPDAGKPVFELRLAR